VTLDAVRSAFATLSILKGANKFVEHLIDSGFEETVPVAKLVSLLRGAGLDGSTALDVRKLALKKATVVLDPVSCIHELDSSVADVFAAFFLWRRHWLICA
jgi:hypothetical protein